MRRGRRRGGIGNAERWERCVTSSPIPERSTPHSPATIVTPTNESASQGSSSRSRIYDDNSRSPTAPSPGQLDPAAHPHRTKASSRSWMRASGRSSLVANF